MKKTMMILLAGLSLAPLTAQDARHLDVVGVGEVRLAPDQAVITLGVESAGTDLGAARKDNDARMSRVLAVPATFGVAAGDVKTDFASIDPQYDMGPRGNTRTITGYQVTKVVSVVIRDLAKVETFVQAALAAGANRLDRVAFGLSDPSAAEAQARLLAVRDARTKATALATELGAKLGKVLWLVEQSDGGSPQPMFRMAAAQAGGDTFAPGRLTVTARLSLSFALE